MSTISIIVAVVLVAITVGFGFLYVTALKRKTKGTAYLVIAIVGAVALLLVPASIHTVQPGEVAVVKVWGKAEYTRSPGTYFDFCISRQYTLYDSTVQQENIKTMCYSADGQTMDITLVVQYKLQAYHAIEIANDYGGLNMLSNRIEAVSIDNAKKVLSTKSAMHIIETRAEVSPEIETQIKSAVANDYYVDIVTVAITNIDFSDAFETTVEDKMIAEQQKLKAEYEKEKAIIEAEKELEVAKLNAQARVASAQGEADAIKAKSIEIARMLGFKITSEVVGDTTSYNIDFSGKTEEEIRLISDYLRYVDYLETWDGTLPTTLVTDGSAQIMLPINY